ncbi:hypothetical protein PM022_19615, partial [Halorubrum ezzemoulense]
TESGESTQLMDNDDVDFPISDRLTEMVILYTTLVISPRNHIGEPFDACVRILLADKLLELADLSLVVLAVGRDAGIQRDVGHTFRFGRVSI